MQNTVIVKFDNDEFVNITDIKRFAVKWANRSLIIFNSGDACEIRFKTKEQLTKAVKQITERLSAEIMEISGTLPSEL